MYKFVESMISRLKELELVGIDSLSDKEFDEYVGLWEELYGEKWDNNDGIDEDKMVEYVECVLIG